MLRHCSRMREGLEASLIQECKVSGVGELALQVAQCVFAAENTSKFPFRYPRLFTMLQGSNLPKQAQRISSFKMRRI